MMILLALALAANPQQKSDQLISDWATCMNEYALPRLRDASTEMIVDQGLVACAAQESAVRKSYIHDFGPTNGANAFAGLRHKVREHMIAIVDTGKAQRGYR